MIAATLLASGASFGAEPPYYRFWRGWKLPALSETGFLTGLNDVFVPATVATGSCKGLISYQPALPPSPTDRGEASAYLPDEIALVAYESERAYRAIRETPEGQRYADLHWEYFDRSRSRSLVPGVFDGKAEADHAYDLRRSQADWQQGFSIVRLWTRKPGLAGDDYFERLSAYVDRLRRGFPEDLLLSVVVLVADPYVIEYLLWPTEDVYRAMKDTIEESLERGMRELILDPLLERPARRESRIEFGQALNVPFATTGCP